MEELHGLTENLQTSRYNEAINQLIRLNNLWQLCNEHSRSGKLMQWRWDLDAVWRELSFSAKKLNEMKKFADDETDWKKKKKQLITKIEETKTRSELYMALNNYEEFLRELQDTSGKGSAWEDTDYDDFD